VPTALAEYNLMLLAKAAAAAVMAGLEGIQEHLKIFQVDCMVVVAVVASVAVVSRAQAPPVLLELSGEQGGPSPQQM
jgi:hypothetical protein